MYKQTKQRVSKSEELERFNVKKWEKEKGDIQIRKITPPHSFENFDFTMSSGNTIYIGEVKNRNMRMNKYKCAILEQYKCDAIYAKMQEFKEKYPQHNFAGLYIAFYQDGWAMWDLLKFEGAGNYWLPQTTTGWGNQEKKILTPCLEYYWEDVIQIKKTNIYQTKV